MHPLVKKLPKKLVRLWPRYWRSSWQLNANLIGEIFGVRPFAKVVDMFEAYPSDWAVSVNRRWRYLRHETGLPVALALLALCSAIAFVWWKAANLDTTDLWPELGGMVFDIFVILIVYEGLQHRRFRREATARQQEIIDDFKRWDSEEARLRIAGAIRRLNRMGKTALNFSGATLSNFQFAKAGIGTLKGSTFFDGRWGQPIGDSSVKLTSIDFDRVDLRAVIFSPFEPLGFMGKSDHRHCQLIDCSFRDLSLEGAIFNGAALSWTEVPPDAHERRETDDDGKEFWVPDSYGPFYRCDLAGAKFVGCQFENVDFRGATGFEEADFGDCLGLEDAIFDSEAERYLALKPDVKRLPRLPSTAEAFGQWYR